MKWFARLVAPEAHDQWQMPPVTYYLIRLVDACAPAFIRASEAETRLLAPRLRKIRIDRPIYICGIARAGTTITLELVSRHPAVGTHFYSHMPVPYLPYWWPKMEAALPIPAMQPVERVHKDGLMVTKDSPEAVEEAFWQKFFPHLHDEARFNPLTEQTQNPTFERFYRDHIRKLLLCQNRSRYAVKNNYNFTRLSYLRKLFPDARFVLVVRDPVHHLASLIKQHRLFTEMAAADPKSARTMQRVGHHEFGVDTALINIGGDGLIERIRDLWARGREVKGWALYWASVYGFVADQLESHPGVRKNTVVIRYEDLCADSAGTIDRILDHAGLSREPFADIRSEYAGKLNPPGYYRPKFTDAELDDIREATRKVAARFGYAY